MSVVRLSTSRDAPRNLEIWRSAVAATHAFLTPEDLARIDGLVSDWLSEARPWVLVNEDDRPLGFMALTGAHIDALFVDSNHHGSGVGRALIGHARSLHAALTVDVNEQNPGAVGFYQRLNFERTGRSPVDGQGRPYPLLHLAWRR